MFSFFFFFKQKTAYEMRISDWSSDVCSSDLGAARCARALIRPPGTFSREREKGFQTNLIARHYRQPFSCAAGEGGAQRRMRARAQRSMLLLLLSFFCPTPAHPPAHAPHPRDRTSVG